MSETYTENAKLWKQTLLLQGLNIDDGNRVADCFEYQRVFNETLSLDYEHSLFRRLSIPLVRRVLSNLCNEGYYVAVVKPFHKCDEIILDTKLDISGHKSQLNLDAEAELTFKLAEELTKEIKSKLNKDDIFIFGGFLPDSSNKLIMKYQIDKTDSIDLI